MKLHHLINPELMTSNIHCDAKENLIHTLISLSLKSKIVQKSGLDFDSILEKVMAREAMSTTGIGKGIAIPHARFDELEDVVICMATLSHELDFQSVDSKPVRVAAMLLIPQSMPTKGLQAIAQITRLFSESRDEVVSAQDNNALIKVISYANLVLDQPIMAKDIMSKQALEITPAMSLHQVSALMGLHKLHAVGVTDETGVLCGEITSDRLLNLGVPDFFKNLKSVSFVSYFDPFESYFEKEASSRALDVMTQDYCTINRNTTILEIVFALTVKKYPVLYVVDNNKLIGVVDKSIVLDKIINY
ncbi:MAG: PTS sugar transporter subunit IIA [Candidatus Marinimicrobia bacterium]|nr:PTS sugar transporter subunit IIA [Candidatus Neomarinimicrobiota bacterium]